MARLITDRVDWKIDRTTWDVIVPLQPVAGLEGVAQRIAILLRMIRGEWFANMSKGMPWYKGNGVAAADAILGNAFQEVRTRAEVRKIIMSVEEVSSIERLSVTFNRRSRRMKIEWRAKTIWGDTVADQLEQPTDKAA